MGSSLKLNSSCIKCLASVAVCLFFNCYSFDAKCADIDAKPQKQEENINNSAQNLGDNLRFEDKTIETEEQASSFDQNNNNENAMNEPTTEKKASSSDTEKSSQEQEKYPGVKNASIRHKIADGPSLEIFYPIFGNSPVDAAIKTFVDKQVQEYQEEILDFNPPDEEDSASAGHWELSGNFSLEYPNPNVVSVIFNIYTYTGGAHGNVVISCLNFDLKTGKTIDFADLFQDPEKALEMMSSFSAKKLNTELGDYADEDMINSGTAPDLINFSNLSLVPNGLFIEFQPYQVGPWAAGPQRVEMTLQELAPAGPEPIIWPQAIQLAPAKSDQNTEINEVPDSTLTQ